MRGSRPSKNSRCPCGSGKKYRKCHGAQRRLLAQTVELHRINSAKRTLFQEKHGLAKPPVSIRLNDKRLIAIGNRIYQQTQEGEYGFVNLCHDCGLELFGMPYLDAEEKKPLADRHPALQWMYTYVEHHQALDQNQVKDLAAHQIGAGGAWFRFGYDLYTIRDNAKLHAQLQQRLLDPKNFQGARYELAVAATCISAGFDLSFEDETDNSNKHPEFRGTDRRTGARISVEAKSRHRYGVKGFSAGHSVAPGKNVGVRGLVLDAYEKKIDSPYYVFVDVNLPPISGDDEYRGWLSELDQTMADLAAEGYADPCPANAVIFTNDPSHYLPNSPIGSPSDNLWFKHYEAQEPRFAHPSSDMVDRFFKAFSARITPPSKFPDF